jgi:hypothetical protein
MIAVVHLIALLFYLKTITIIIDTINIIIIITLIVLFCFIWLERNFFSLHMNTEHI